MHLSSYDIAMSQVLLRYGLRRPDVLGALWQFMDRLSDPEFGRPIRDAINPIYCLAHEAYGFAEIWGRVFKGDTAYTILPIDQTCGSDTEVEHNNSILCDQKWVFNNGGTVKPLRYHAEFIGGPGDDDGHFTTLSELVATRHIQGQDGCYTQTVIVQPRMYPLEVGSCAVGRIVNHVFAELGVVRWPYRDKNLYVFHRIRPEIDRIRVIASVPCGSADELPRKPDAYARG